MHTPVLKKEVKLFFLDIKGDKTKTFLDGTLGLAGHSLAILENNPDLIIIGLDKDESALGLAKKTIKNYNKGDYFILEKSDFKDFEIVLDKYGVKCLCGALLDLGVSSMQLDIKERGFSFRDQDSDLDMRMDQGQSLSAEDVLNSYTKDRLEQILKDYGEERFAKIIAKNIIESRKVKPIKKVKDLLEILERSIPPQFRHKGKIHYATRTFQALRIEVNQELENLGLTIKKIANRLAPGSRLAIISFHSLEDRIVKNTFRELEDPCNCPKDMPCVCGLKKEFKILTKKPVTADQKEIAINARSRSAKLRVIEKL